MQIDETYDAFIKCMNIDESKYLGLVKHTSDNIGFSVYRPLNEELIRKLQVKPGSEYRTLVAVGFHPHKKAENDLQPLLIRMNLCLYDNNEYILNYYMMKKTNMIPIEINEANKYYFNLSSKKICLLDGQEIDSRFMIEEIYKRHI